MKIKLYQIAPEKDDKNLMLMGYKFTVLHGGINADSYELVFDGDLPVQTAEDVFRIFNLEHPNGYRGRRRSRCRFGASAAENAASMYICRFRSKLWMHSVS